MSKIDQLGYAAKANPAVARGLLALTAFNAHTLSDISAALAAYGSSGITGAVATTKRVYPTTSPYGMLDHATIVDPDDFAHLMVGLNAYYCSHVLFSSYGKAEATQLFSRLYGVPPTIASEYADKIETSDHIDTSGLSWTAWKNWAYKQYNDVAEGISKAGNMFGFDWNFGDSQAWDVDKLYELLLTGEQLVEMSKRSALVKSSIRYAGSISAGVASGKSLIKDPAGDVEFGDVSIYDEEEGDTVLKSIPGFVVKFVRTLLAAAPKHSALLGNAAGEMAQANTNSSRQQVTSMLNGPYGSYLHSVLDAIHKGTPNGKRILKASMSPIDKAQVRVMAQGELMGELVDEIGDIYGGDVAECWQNGDVEGIIDAVLATPFTEKDAKAFSETGDAEEGVVVPVAAAMIGRRLAKRKASSARAKRRYERRLERAKARAQRKATRAQRAEFRRAGRQALKDSRAYEAEAPQIEDVDFDEVANEVYGQYDGGQGGYEGADEGYYDDDFAGFDDDEFGDVGSDDDAFIG